MSSGRIGVIAATALIPALPLSSASGAAPHSSLAGSRTAVTVFHGFTAAGKPTLPVKVKKGSCFTGSLSAGRSDAWRCLVGNFILDPCFSSAAAPGRVVCPNAGVTGMVEIKLTKQLPRKEADRGRPSRRAQPWDIQLSDGRHCVFSSGASNEVQGQRLNYFCGPGGAFGLWGLPDRKTEPWTILSAPADAKKLSHRSRIRRVWT